MTESVNELRPSTDVDRPVPGEPEKLVLPAEAVAELIQFAIRGPEGNAWWRGFVTAHGFPSWIVQGTWRLECRECAILPGVPGAAERNGAVARRG